MTRPEQRARMAEILARYEAGETAKGLAKEFGLSATHIKAEACRRRAKPVYEQRSEG